MQAHDTQMEGSGKVLLEHEADAMVSSSFVLLLTFYISEQETSPAGRDAFSFSLR